MVDGRLLVPSKVRFSKFTSVGSPKDVFEYIPSRDALDLIKEKTGFNPSVKPRFPMPYKIIYQPFREVCSPDTSLTSKP